MMPLIGKSLDFGFFLSSEPVIPPCDTGQQIPCFDSCQLTKISMSIYQAKRTLATKFDITHWFPCGVDGRADLQTVT